MIKRMLKLPRWKSKIEKEINTIKREVSIIEEILRGVKTKLSKLNKMRKKYLMKKTDDLPSLKETLTQKMQRKMQRIRKSKKRTKFYRQNNISEIPKNKFYRELGKKQVIVKKPPTKD